MAMAPARRPSRRQIIPNKVAERLLNMKNAKAVGIYDELVKPFLVNLEGMANARARGNKALADEMFANVVVKIIAAAKKRRVKNPRHFALKVARNAMLEVAMTESLQSKIVKIKTPEHFLEIVDPRPEAELTRAKAAQTVNNLLSRAGLSKPIEGTVVYHFGLDDRKPKTLAQTAKHFGIPAGTAASRITSAIKKLRNVAGVKK